MDTSALVARLNGAESRVRLDALTELAGLIASGEIPRPATGEDINNHIHTSFSFSPYSPAMAVWMAYTAGLRTAGIVDHDTIAGAEEFIEAGKILGFPTTIGVECRVDMSKTPLGGRRLNNTDQDSLAYVVLHGVPHGKIGEVTAFFKPYTERRNARTRKMTAKANSLLAKAGIAVDFDADVVSLSQYPAGGSITERHLAFALAKALVARFGKGSALVDFLSKELALPVSEKIAKLLSDGNNVHYEYDLLGFIKSDFITSFYVDATDECPDARDFIALAERTGGVSAYAYLGDVTDSVTGDKRAQKFEDDFLDGLFDVIADLGFRAVTYMPPRNSPAQLARVRALCDAKGFFQISGVDINSPRQAFVCPEMRGPEFENLRTAAWALIGHELAATADPEDGMFTEKTIKAVPSLNGRIAAFALIGQKSAEKRYNGANL